MSKGKGTQGTRRELIVLSALHCFTQHGFHQTSMRHIATEAKVSLGNLYNYFTGKGEIIKEIAGLESQEQSVLISTLEQQPLAAIQKFATIYLEQLSQPDRIKLTVEIIAECTRDPEIALIFADNQRTITSALTTTIARGIQSGDIRQNIQSEILAELIIDGIEGCAMRKSLFSDTSTTGHGLIQLLLTLLKNTEK
ncbi:TetR/AcrR family transcriptional regulator [Budvicia aquatica]|uniref:TetR/AcrR family transcriptional regulator n=1 Tax=Budvicia aquatica TaxID=82979 RepID=UPI00207FF41F|nr:TetR/AcrR family transcriptional regulator [Budvicia aquatica]GKX51296.1 hypothetical protein SOASR029_16050 [Budvicia aquatica]